MGSALHDSAIAAPLEKPTWLGAMLRSCRYCGREKRRPVREAGAVLGGLASSQRKQKAIGPSDCASRRHEAALVDAALTCFASVVRRGSGEIKLWRLHKSVGILPKSRKVNNPTVVSSKRA